MYVSLSVFVTLMHNAIKHGKLFVDEFVLDKV